MFTDKDFLQIKGDKVVNQSGETVMLRGTNFGGWLHREGWMDGAGACLMPVQPVSAEKTEKGYRLDFEKICRVNRLKVTGNRSGDYVVKTSLDGEAWTEAGRGNFADERESYTDHYKPAPYAPGVNVYDEGDFVQGDMIHTNEFFAKSLILEAEDVTEVQAYRYGDIDEFNARKIIEGRFGQEKAEELLAGYQDIYIQEKDIDYIKSLGFNFVRIPIYWQEIVTPEGELKANAWDNLDWILAKCCEKEIYVMLDYHGAPGGNTLGSITAGQLDSNELWHHQEYLDISMKIWREMSARYKDNPTVAVYDLLNEPTAFPVSFGPMNMEGIGLPDKPVGYFVQPESLRRPVRNYYQDACRTVRGNDDHHILCVQQFSDAGLVDLAEMTEWDNLMVQFHCYPMGDWRDHDQIKVSMEAYLEVVTEYAKTWQVPVLVGEFCFWEFEDVWKSWMDGLNEAGLHWASWSYKITDPEIRDNWSLLYGYQGTYVDYLTDECDTIREKWSGYDSENYKKNKLLETILKTAAAK